MFKQKVGRCTVHNAKLKSISNKRKFKAAVRLVIRNLNWLVEEVAQETELGENVMQNVMMLMHKKKEDNQFLKFYDKLILYKPADNRTEEEKQHIHKIIGGLKCFRKYPLEVQIQLASVTYFRYYPPGRIIVKQYREGEALYIIASGEVAVTIDMYDVVLGKMVETSVGTMTAGQVFGEVSLLHDIPRAATMTTSTHCEFICLLKDDFNNILKKFLKAQWDEILLAMTRFGCFDFFDSLAKRECCIYGKIQTYKKGEIVFGTLDSLNYVHFLLKGQCSMIERITVVEEEKYGVKYLKMFNLKKYLAERKKLGKDIQRKSIDVERISTISSQASVGFIGKLSTSRELDADVHSFIIERSGQALGNYFGNTDDMKQTDYELPNYVKSIFVQVCFFNELACFGLGETMSNRHIVAASEDVKCLLLPRYLILQRNKGNIWFRLINFLNTHIPSTKEVFKLFVADRKWNGLKDKLIKSVVRKPPVNVLNNVPYSIRLRYNATCNVMY